MGLASKMAGGWCGERKKSLGSLVQDRRSCPRDLVFVVGALGTCDSPDAARAL